MELGIREWLIVFGVILLIVVLLDGIRQVRRDRSNQIKFGGQLGSLHGAQFGSGEFQEDPISLDVGKPRDVIRDRSRSPARQEPTLERPLIVAEPEPRQASLELEQADLAPQPAERAPAPSEEQEPSAHGEPSAQNEALMTQATQQQQLDDEVPESIPMLNEVVSPVTTPSSSLATSEDSEAPLTDLASDQAFTPIDQPAQQESIFSWHKNRLLAGRKSRTEKITQHKPKPLPLDLSPAEFIIINVLSRHEQGFNGADLMQILLACDLRFGKKNIFHRHERKNGTGPVQFSMANITEPGTFDINTIESFQTSGVSFFMTLPGPDNPLKAYEYMWGTANCVAKNLQGDLLDEARSTMTAQTAEHNRQRVQEFERRQLTVNS